jgi:rhamnogalacturonan endolyase
MVMRWFGQPTFLCVLLAALLAPAAPTAAVQIRVTDDHRQVELANELLTATFQLAAQPGHLACGDLVSLRTAQEGELLAHGGKGYFLASTTEASRVLNGGEYRVVRQRDDVAEVAFTRRFADVVMELHYVLRRNESGLYVFLVQRHEAAMPPVKAEQTLYYLRVDPARFTYAFTSDTKSGPLVSPEALSQGQKIQDATYRLADGTVYTKYDWADFWDHHWGHGLTGTNVGVWMIPGGQDYLVGGPTKQELIVHATDTTPVMMQIFRGGHFLSDEDGEPPVTGDWAKLSGPVFIYVNSGGTPRAMREDAKRCAAQLATAWPYRWMDNPLYPLERGTVTGRLNLSGGPLTECATVMLAAPAPDWQKQWSTYNFWTHADSNGIFVLPKVRPGRYTLYSFASGIPGEFRRDEVTVQANQTNALGELAWAPPSHGKLLWQIGVPDRSAGEFRHGEEPRQYGLWHHYFQDFPNDVNFVIGQSRERTDWNYAEPVLQTSNGTYHLPTWNIRFKLAEAPHGEATLTLAIAGVEGHARIETLVNGVAAGKVVMDNDSSVRRSANQAGQYRLRLVRFDAARLRLGENTIGLRLVVHAPEDKVKRDYPIAAVMYDYVRLEVLPPENARGTQPKP